MLETGAVVLDLTALIEVSKVVPRWTVDTVALLHAVSVIDSRSFKIEIGNKEAV